jgi:hypothetical protein
MSQSIVGTQAYSIERDLRLYVDPWDEELSEVSEASAATKVTDTGHAIWQFHSEQLKAWQSAARTKVIVAGRRWGKSQLMVQWALAGAMDDNLRGIPGITWVILPTFNMARPLWRKFMKLAPPGWITHASGGEKNFDYFALGNARIEFKSGDHPERLVGEGLCRVVMDECGEMKESVYNESIIPALMDHSAPAMLGGTPKGRNWFYKQYMAGLDPEVADISTFGGPTLQNPWIKPAEVERARAVMATRLFNQEILAHFLDDDGAVFRGVRACLMPGGKYSTLRTVAIGVDLARKSDFTVLIGLDAYNRVTFMDRFSKGLSGIGPDWPLQKLRIKAAYEKYGRPRMLIDATGAGDPVVQDLQRDGLARAQGFIFTPQSKAEIIEALSLGIEQRRLGLPDEPVLVNELESYEFTTSRVGNVRYSAPANEHDDCVCALALAYKAAKRAGDSGVS